MKKSDLRAYKAECLWTAMLVIGGCWAAIFAAPVIGILWVALAFWFSLWIIAYTLGHISGAHVNPAVTISLAMAGKFDSAKVAPYIVAQLIGWVIWALVLYAIASGIDGFSAAGWFAANSLQEWVSMRSGFLVEVVMTFFLCLGVLATTTGKFPAKMVGMHLALLLGLIHLVSIPLTNTSVNPARSLGPALFSGGASMTELWMFFVAPVVWAVLAALCHKMLNPKSK